MKLNDDIFLYIARFFPTINIHYFQVSKQLYQLKKKHYNWYANHYGWGTTDESLETKILLYHFKHLLRRDPMHYREFVLKFIIDEENETFFQCNNEHYRQLVHQFCEDQNLLHVTKTPDELKKIKICKFCNRENLIKIFPCHEGYYDRCKYCNLGLFKINKFVDLVGVHIAKKK